MARSDRRERLRDGSGGPVEDQHPAVHGADDAKCSHTGPSPLKLPRRVWLSVARGRITNGSAVVAAGAASIAFEVRGDDEGEQEQRRESRPTR